MSGSDITTILFFIIGGAIGVGVVIALIVVAAKITGKVVQFIFWIVANVFKAIGGAVSDVVRLVGNIVTALVALSFSIFSVILGRWPSAEKWGGRLKRSTLLTGYLIYSIVLRRPLQLVGLDRTLPGMEQAPATAEATNAASVAGPSAGERRDPASFDGYAIEGTLR